MQERSSVKRTFKKARAVYIQSNMLVTKFLMKVGMYFVDSYISCNV